MWDMTAAESAQPASLVPQWTFADRMRKIRTDVLDLHQHEMAERVGVTKAAYAAWESGRTQPRDILALARRVELLSHVPAAWLLGIEAPTGTDTSRYFTPYGPDPVVLKLVPPLDDTYPDGADGYGSCTPIVSHDSSRYVPESTGTVNDADAA